MPTIRPIILSCALLIGGASIGLAQTPAPGQFPPPRQNYVIQTPTDLADYFTAPATPLAAPDTDGFIRRWTILEPIAHPVHSNVVFTDSYLNHILDSVQYNGQLAIIPRDRQTVKVAGKKLQFHTLDSRLFNVKLYRMAAAMKKPVYGVIFHAVTIIDCPEEITDVRLSAGSNSASKWWLNSEPILLLSGDRRMVADDAVSPRITLKKGRNILRTAIINGPGMSDFCARFILPDGQPLTTYTIPCP